ncbi:MAG: EscU/YscU/HrcU family type III secretion system export apparatus switch protein [Deltaproteobacteria bacterium]|nr:EscU/YscU/HrcU family type III secretion system export apparatus switch protein [Deltaproteobacteria bacterium]MCB9787782.1 EscU/YscU/HrcU family type III secretion system export apparatus switch protein [Deltaproteobacteria bacterium]
MAEDSSKEDKVFDPSPQRVEEYRRQGRVAQSRDVGSAAQLAMALLAFSMLGMPALGAMLEGTRWAIQHAAGGDGIPPTTASTFVAMFKTMGPPVIQISLLMALAASAAGFAQTRFNWAPEALGFKLDRINPIQRLSDTFSPKKFASRALLATAKLTLAGLVIGGIFMADLPAMRGLAAAPLGTAERFLRTNLWEMLLATTLVLTILAVVDYIYQKNQYDQQLKMTREEFVRDMEQTEGKPAYKQRRRQMHRELSMNRILKEVPTADVIVTNPTHLAIALQYRPGKDKAPRVTARGADDLALHIRRLARRHGVPIIEQRALARTLWRRCKVGRPVPDTLFQEVARVLARVYRARSQRLRPTRRG